MQKPQDLLKDPWGNKFVYIHPHPKYRNNPSKYVLFSLGLDKKEGGIDIGFFDTSC